MVIELIKYVVFCINSLLPKVVISAKYIPRTILTGTKINFKERYKLLLGAYVQDHEDRVKINTMQEQSRGSI